MYRGTMIDELIAAVMRAEASARDSAPVQRKSQPVLSEPVYPQIMYQAPFISALMGAA